MAAIVWDKLESRTFETGLDRGVLYLNSGQAVPWNGLTSIIENPDRTSSPVYFDGRKTIDLVDVGDYSATMRALTYPDEFLEVEGHREMEPGVFFADQNPTTFGLSYRTLLGDGIVGEARGYRLHLLYSLTAVPANKSYRSVSDDTEAIEFEWKITGVPQNFLFVRPTSHVIIDSVRTDPDVLSELEDILYGTPTSDPRLISPSDLLKVIDYV